MWNLRSNIFVFYKTVFVLILICFVLFLAEPRALNSDDFSESKRNISIVGFEMTSGSPSLKDWEKTIPEALKAYFVSFGWSVEIVSELAESKEKKLENTPLNIQQTITSEFMERRQGVMEKSKNIIKGYFFETQGLIRIDAIIENRETGANIPVPIPTFNQTDILNRIELLGSTLKSKIESIFSKQSTVKKIKLAIKCFEGKSGEYEWVGKELVRDLTMKLSHLETIEVVKWVEMESRKIDIDIVVSGQYKIKNNNHIDLITTITRTDDNESLAKLEDTGSVDNFFELIENYSKSLKEILIGMITPKGIVKLRDVLPEDLDAMAYFEKGNYFYEKGNRVFASIMYKNALKEKNDMAMAHFQLGRIFEENKEYEKAFEKFNLAVKFDPKLSNAYLHLGDISFKMEEYDNAIDFYKDALKLDNKSIETYMKIGDVYILEAQYNEAIKVYEQAKAIYPNNADIFYSIGNVYSIQEKYQEAIEEFRKAISVDPKHEKSLNYLSQVHYKEGERLIKAKKYQEALSEINKSIALKKSAAAYSRLGWVKFEMATKENKDQKKVYNKLITKDKKKVYKNLITEAIDAQKKAINEDSNYAWAHAGLGRALLEKAKTKKGYDKAIVEFREARRLDPKHGFAQLWLGVALKKLGLTDTAVDLFKEAWQISIEKKRYDWAIDAMKFAIKIKKDDSSFHVDLAMTYYLNDEEKKAIEEFVVAIRIKPDLLENINIEPKEYHHQLAHYYSNTGEYDKAIDELRKAIEIDPTIGKYNKDIGDVYFKKGEYDNAITEYKIAIDMESNSNDAATLYKALGDAYIKKGDYKEAIENYKQAHTRNFDLQEVLYSSADFHRAAGDFYYDRKKYNKAAYEYIKVITMDPSDVTIPNKLGDVLKIKEEYNIARSEHKKAMNINPNLTDEVECHLGDVINKLQCDGNVLGKSDKLADVMNNDSEFNETILFNDLGFQAVCSSEELCKKEQVNCEKAIKLNPTDATLYGKLGDLHFKKGEYDEAVKNYRMAINCAPVDAKFLKKLGDSYGKKGEYDKAIEEYEIAIVINPDDVDLYSNLAWIYAIPEDNKNYDPRKANNYISEAIEKLHGDEKLSVLNIAARVYHINDQHHKALETIQNILKIDPEYYKDTQSDKYKYTYKPITENQ